MAKKASKTIVVEQIVRPTNYFPTSTVLRVWRKGAKFRVEHLRPENREWTPPTDADATWWKEHQKDFEFVPKLICNGNKYWDYYLADSWKAGTPVPKAGAPSPFGPAVCPAFTVSAMRFQPPMRLPTIRPTTVSGKVD